MTFSVVTALVLLASSGVLVAQDVARDTVFGMVRDASGEPWPGATVELLSRLIPDDESVGGVDHVVATTNQRGSFRAAILPGRAYTAWAWKVVGERGYETTAITEGVVPRDAIVLGQGADLGYRRRVSVTAAADGVRTPLRVFVRVAAENVLVVPVPLDEDGVGVLPPLPAGTASLEVLDATGMQVASRAIASGDDEPIAIPIPALDRVRVLVRDIDSELAPSGAFLVAVSEGRWVRVGVVDGDGCAILPKSPIGRWLAYADHCAPAQLQAGDEPKRQDGRAWPELRPDFVPEWHAHVGPGVTLKGRVKIGDQNVVGGGWLAIHEHAMHYSERNSRSLQYVRRSQQIGADGRFEVPWLLAEFAPILDLVLTPAHVAALPERWRDGVHPVVPFIAQVREGAADGDGVLDVGDIDLLDLVPVRLSVVASDGTPALGASLRFERLGGTFQLGRPGGPVFADRSGVAVVLLPAEREFIAVVATRDGLSDWVTIEVGRPERGGGPHPARVTLRPPVVVEGRVVDRNGNPVERMTLRVTPTPTSAIGMRGPRDGRIVAGADAVVVRPIVEPDVLRAVARSIQPGITTRTDADGRFRVELPMLPMTYRLQGAGVQVQVEIDEDGGPAPLELEVSR